LLLLLIVFNILKNIYIYKHIYNAKYVTEQSKL